MSQGLTIDIEHTAAHINDYIEDGKLFDIFEIEVIEKIMKYTKLTTDQYITLLKQSYSTINAKELYISTRNATLSVKNSEEVVSILKSIIKYMKFNILEGIIDVINQQERRIRDLEEENKKMREDLKVLQKQRQNEIKATATTKEKSNDSRDILVKIAELKNSDNFASVIKFLDELSMKGNREMMSKACQEGLWLKTFFGSNVLHCACREGNLRLVKSLIECNCDIETKDTYANTPLFYASSDGHLAVVQYLISVGANKEARDNSGNTPLMLASAYGHLAVVQYLISVGANKYVKNIYGRSPLMVAADNVKYYLNSIGAY